MTRVEQVKQGEVQAVHVYPTATYPVGQVDTHELEYK